MRNDCNHTHKSQKERKISKNLSRRGEQKAKKQMMTTELNEVRIAKGEF